MIAVCQVFWVAPLTGSLIATLVWKALKLLDPPIADEPAASGTKVVRVGPD